MTKPTSDHPFSKPFHLFEQRTLAPWLSDSSWVPHFLKIADVIKIPGQKADQDTVLTSGKTGDETFQPTYLSNLQPNSADKETFMQNSFSPQNLVEADRSNGSSSNGSSPNSSSPYGAVNQSPEDKVLSEPLLDANANREKVIPINGAHMSSAVDNARKIAALSSELEFANHQLFDLKAELRSIQQMEQRTYDRISQFERQQKQAEIQRSQLRLAQDQQLERRLRGFIEKFIAITLHNTIERLGLARMRGGSVPEPARRPSTYSVPKRENTGIYRQS